MATWEKLQQTVKATRENRVRLEADHNAGEWAEYAKRLGKHCIQATDGCIVPVWHEVGVLVEKLIHGDGATATTKQLGVLLVALRQEVDYCDARAKQWEERCHDITSKR